MIVLFGVYMDPLRLRVLMILIDHQPNDLKGMATEVPHHNRLSDHRGERDRT